ncbi:MAG: hypothetical protein JWM11_3464 [Planctomycetaceae bacterium]|nr:hypothetical protein [Planctomycetaceae bacterium]
MVGIGFIELVILLILAVLVLGIPGTLTLLASIFLWKSNSEKSSRKKEG